MITSINKPSETKNSNFKWTVSFLFFSLVGYVLIFSSNLYLLIICTILFLYKFIRLIKNIYLMSTKLTKREGISGDFEFGSKKQIKNTIGFKKKLFTELYIFTGSIVDVVFTSIILYYIYIFSDFVFFYKKEHRLLVKLLH